MPLLRFDLRPHLATAVPSLFQMVEGLQNVLHGVKGTMCNLTNSIPSGGRLISHLDVILEQDVQHALDVLQILVVDLCELVRKDIG